MAKFLNVEQVAERYSVSIWSIWRWSKSPDNPFPKPSALGTQTKRWSVEELDKYDARIAA